jgi:hypothetical protein
MSISGGKSAEKGDGLRLSSPPHKKSPAGEQMPGLPGKLSP